MKKHFRKFLQAFENYLQLLFTCERDKATNVEIDFWKSHFYIKIRLLTRFLFVTHIMFIVNIIYVKRYY